MTFRLCTVAESNSWLDDGLLSGNAWLVRDIGIALAKILSLMHLSEHHGDCCPGSTVFVWMTGIEDFHATITSRGYGYMRPGIERTFYNSVCVEVTDPFGNRIRFNEARAEAAAVELE